jgi:hypothetical protein
MAVKHRKKVYEPYGLAIFKVVGVWFVVLGVVMVIVGSG